MKIPRIIKIIVCFFVIFSQYIFAYEYDIYGGFDKVQGEKTGYFHTKEINNIWWLIDPLGNAFYSKGICNIEYLGDGCPKLNNKCLYGEATKKKYTNEDNYIKAVANNFKNWNFNTNGAWSDKETYKMQIPYCVILDIATNAGGDWEKGIFPDVFDKKFDEAADSRCKKLCEPHADDPFLLGYFTDNELNWSANWKIGAFQLMDYLEKVDGAAGKNEAVKFLNGRYKGIDDLNEAWGSSFNSFETIRFDKTLEKNAKYWQDCFDFLKLIAKRYFSVCNKAIKKYDINHLNLGCRFSGIGNAESQVISEMEDNVDVVSVNNYKNDPSAEIFKKTFSMTKRPIMVTEFSYRGKDSELPNTKGAGPIVETQKDRAKHFEKYVTELVNIPFVVGYHWFEYTDEPNDGRFDGENSNYGVVNINDDIYETLVDMMKNVNSKVEELHLKCNYAKK